MASCPTDFAECHDIVRASISHRRLGGYRAYSSRGYHALAVVYKISGRYRVKPCLLRDLRGGGVYDLTGRRRVALQVQQREQPALERVHAGQTGGCRVLPLALPTG